MERVRWCCRGTQGKEERVLKILKFGFSCGISLENDESFIVGTWEIRVTDHLTKVCTHYLANDTSLRYTLEIFGNPSIETFAGVGEAR